MDDTVSSEDVCPHCGQPMPAPEVAPEPETEAARVAAMRKAAQETPFILGI